MSGSRTFGQKLGLGFAAVVACTLVIGAVSAYALRAVVVGKDAVIGVSAQNLIDTRGLEAATANKTAEARAFLLTGQEGFLASMRREREDLTATIARLRKQPQVADERQLVDQVERAEEEHQAALDLLITRRGADGTMTAGTVGQQFDELAAPKRAALSRAIEALIVREEQLLEEGKLALSRTATAATATVVTIALVATALAIVIALVLGRALSRQIGSAVQHIQSSSAELQAAANQQASSTTEQVSAMAEITTTIRELLSTSRQIAESAQRVARIANDTAAAARGGEQVVLRAQDALATIKRQIDQLVQHMLDLGRRSQQIGGVLEVVNELLEQTNILAINATIEASGAGESGKRFAAVADEIRKLSDRVGGSAREIRNLVDEVRAAVNTTVMATEGGAKAVDAGAQQFAEVTGSFKEIAGQVGTTTEAAREIELSTKQQATAVEQVNVAVANVAQTSKETEASATQTLQTASQLATLSRDLSRLVQPAASA